MTETINPNCDQCSHAAPGGCAASLPRIAAWLELLDLVGGVTAGRPQQLVGLLLTAPLCQPAALELAEAVALHHDQQMTAAGYYHVADHA